MNTIQNLLILQNSRKKIIKSSTLTETILRPSSQYFSVSRKKNKMKDCCKEALNRTSSLLKALPGALYQVSNWPLSTSAKILKAVLRFLLKLWDPSTNKTKPTSSAKRGGTIAIHLSRKLQIQHIRQLEKTAARYLWTTRFVMFWKPRPMNPVKRILSLIKYEIRSKARFCPLWNRNWTLQKMARNVMSKG